MTNPGDLIADCDFCVPEAAVRCMDAVCREARYGERVPYQPWDVRWEGGWWRVAGSDGAALAWFVGEGDARAFAEMAGPGATPVAALRSEPGALESEVGDDHGSADRPRQELRRDGERINSLQSELDFLTARAVAEHLLQHPRCYGLSSNALALYALGVARRPQVPGTPTHEGGHSWFGDQCGSDYPFDEGDLAACERTFEMAPDHLRGRMRPVLDEFTAWVRERRNRHGVVIP